MKIYVASSWRNPLQPAIVHVLRRSGHTVYDFRHPPGGTGFGWQEVDPAYERGQQVSAQRYVAMLSHPRSALGFKADMDALRECEALVYVLPCGKSASWEFGYAAGQGKKTYVVWFGFDEPELMFRDSKILGSMTELFEVFGEPKESP